MSADHLLLESADCSASAHKRKKFLALFSTVLRPLTGNIKLINDNPNSWQYNTAEREDTVDANWIMVKLKFKMF